MAICSGAIHRTVSKRVGMKKALIILLVLAVAGGAAFGFYRYRTRDERQIKKNIKALAKLVSRTPEDSSLLIEGKAMKFSSFFTTNCRAVYGPPIPDMSGIDDIRIIVSTGLKMFKKLDVEGRDAKVNISSDRQEAESVVTVRISGSHGDEVEQLLDDREVELSWVKVEKLWKVEEARFVPRQP